MKVSIIVLHYSKKDLTAKCLESVKKLDKKDIDLQTIVVNNNPKENLGSLKKRFKKFDFTKTSRNLGYAGGNNFGIKKALNEGADFIFLLNNDTTLDKNCLIQLVKVATLIDQSGILGPRIYFAPGYEFHQDRYSPLQRGKVIWYAGGKIDWKNVLAAHRGVDQVNKGRFNKVQETDFVTGCAIFIKKEVFEKIGLLNSDYFLYLEDNDLCQRARRAGFRVLYVPEAIVWHANAGSSEVGGTLHDYYFTRNRMLFGMKYAPLRAKIALIKESLRLLREGREWQKQGIKDFYLRKFEKGSYPV